jgi:hypothetical protein
VSLSFGRMWWQQVLWKLPPDWGCGDGTRGLCDWIQREIDNPYVPLYRDFLVGFVQPNLSWFGGVIFATELFIAVSLGLGLLLRLGAITSAGMGLQLLVGLHNVPHEWPWTYWFIVMISGLLIAANPGRKFGLDRWVAKPVQDRLPGPLKWLV